MATTVRLPERVAVNGAELEYEVRGAGEPVVLIHGGLLADENAPLLREEALTGRFRVIHYHRRGFAGSSHEPGTIETHAADCRALLAHPGVDRAHVMGHSLGGTIAIQLARDFPESVQSLALLEPALMAAFGSAQGAHRPEAEAAQRAFKEAVERVEERFRAGDRRGALETFLESRAGDAFRGVLEYLRGSGEFEQAVEDADTFLLHELPGGIGWRWTREEAASLRQPVLSVLGAFSPERAQQVHRILSAWLPQTERLVLPSAEHALPLMDPPGIAAALGDFFERRSIAATALAGPLPDPTTGKGRVVFLVRIKPGEQEAFLDAYESIRHAVAEGVPGHLVDQVCQSPYDADSWVITSEWRTLEDFARWERSEGHVDLVAPLREHIAEARSLRFVVREETSAPAEAT